MSTITHPTRTRPRHPDTALERARRLATAAALVIMPTVFVFAFATHPGLGPIQPLEPAELILRARGDRLLQFGHALVTLDAALLVAVAVHLQRTLRGGRGAWAGWLGGCLAVLGACLLAAGKGAMCLTMSALDTVDDRTFAAMLPGLLAIFEKHGWMVLVWGMVLLPIGFAVQAIGLFQAGAWPRWQVAALLAGSLLIGTPDGMEVVNLAAALTLCLALVPEAARVVRTTRAA